MARTLGQSFGRRFPQFVGESGRYALALVGLCLLIRLVPAALIWGADDMGAWIRVAHRIGGMNPYRTGFVNWPPLWLGWLFYARRLTEIYGVPLPFAIKLGPILADLAITLTLYSHFRRDGEARSAFRQSLWYALNPVAFYTSAFHGQFDSFPVLFGLLATLAVYNAKPGVGWLRSTFWLGMAAFAKTWPILLLPGLVREARTYSRKVLYVVMALALPVISVGLLYLDDPVPIRRYVLNYRSAAEWWGLTSLDCLLTHTAAGWVNRMVSWLFYGAMLGTYVFLWRQDRRVDPLRASCLILVTFFVFTSGFGIQYLLWVLPIALLADGRRARLYSLLTSVTITVQYIFRPFNGTYFQFLAHGPQRTAAFFRVYGTAHDKLWNAVTLAPLWLFFVWWWIGLLREARSASRNTFDTAVVWGSSLSQTQDASVDENKSEALSP